MKKRKLNKRGKILITTLTFMLSVLIYVLVAQSGVLATEGSIYLAMIITGWIWLLFGQFGVYAMVWECEV